MANENIKFYDLECLPNFFCGVFMNFEKGDNDYLVFEVSSRRNDFNDFIEFLLSLKAGIGYNIVEYDYPILHELIERREEFSKIPANQLTGIIREMSDRVINAERNLIWRPHFIQRDIYRTWHFFNNARRTSLKWLQFAINWPNLQDYDDLNSDVPEDKYNDVIMYCHNDTASTKEFYYTEDSQDKLSFRRAFGQRYGESIMNFSDSAIGEWVIVKEIEKRTGITKKQLKSMVQPFEPFLLSDIILPNIEFQSREFNKVLNMYRNTLLKSTKGEIEYEIYYDNIKCKFGSGGIHAARKNKNYHTDDNYLVITSDVSSYYPNLAIQQRIRPAHIGEVFFEIYDDLYTERKKYPKGTTENGGIKIALNSIFGKMNHEKSPLFYPSGAMTVTINGQLLFAMLIEMITVAGVGKVVMANTDGIEVYVKREDVERYYNICSQWCELTGLELEHGVYNSLYIRDVNNYLAVTDTGYSYVKGDYEVNKDYHKDHSMKIVPKLTETILKHKLPLDRESVTSMVEHAWNVCDYKGSFDFMIGKRAKSNSYFEERFFDPFSQQPELHTNKLSKTIRYLIVKTRGSYLNKIFTDESNEPEKESKINKGFQVEVCNFWDEEMYEFKKSTIQINYDFYATEILKLLEPVIKVQQGLFD